MLCSPGAESSVKIDSMFAPKSLASLKARGRLGSNLPVSIALTDWRETGSSHARRGERGGGSSSVPPHLNAQRDGRRDDEKVEIERRNQPVDGGGCVQASKNSVGDEGDAKAPEESLNDHHADEFVVLPSQIAANNGDDADDGDGREDGKQIHEGHGRVLV